MIDRKDVLVALLWGIAAGMVVLTCAAVVTLLSPETGEVYKLDQHGDTLYWEGIIGGWDYSPEWYRAQEGRMPQEGSGQ